MLSARSKIVAPAGLFCLVAAAPSLLAQKAQLPDGPGKETTQRICGACHGAEIVIGRKLDKDGWTQVVVSMVQRGAQGTDDEFGEIVDYLTANFSPDSKTNINTATSKDFQTVLGIPEKLGDAIVQYRKEKGSFKSVDDLKNVPGIDASKVDAGKSKLVV
ncbi:MAG TPA: helix-hairpin-helix domain-containing protein [Bryobacteraceae bacterium]|nr:helix-hairpin-helix domain-containing protein [Bryobacteraceae bacterium]